MSNSAGDRLSPLDALFVYLEKKEMPLHIGSVSIFDGPIAVGRLKALVESKLPLIPRYRQRLVFPPLHIGLPTWEWAPDFQIDRHFSHARLKNGTQEELEDLAGAYFSNMMDRSRPLWDILVVDGLANRRSALMIRVHHCLVDGIAGVALMNILFDQSRTPPKLPRKQAFQAPPLPDAGQRFVDALVNAYEEFTTRILSAQAEALNVAQAILGQPPIDSLDQFPGAIPFTSVERLPFNKPVLGPRQFAWTEIPLSDIRTVRQALGGTVNDVVLMLVTSAIRRYCEYHGHSTDGRILRIMVPVNLRRDVIHPGLGNAISFLPVNVPLDIAEPVALLNAIHRITESVKRAHVADVITLTAKWLGTAPAPFQVAFGLLGNNLPLPPWNMVCTNVPGPQEPLYALGRELLTSYPYVPIGNEMAMNCAVESYNGKMYVNFAADTVAVPDLRRVRDFLVTSFHELAQSAAAASAEEAAKESGGETTRPVRRRASKASPRKARSAAIPITAVEPAAARNPATGRRKTAAAGEQAPAEPSRTSRRQARRRAPNPPPSVEPRRPVVQVEKQAGAPGDSQSESPAKVSVSPKPSSGEAPAAEPSRTRRPQARRRAPNPPPSVEPRPPASPADTHTTAAVDSQSESAARVSVSPQPSSEDYESTLAEAISAVS